MNLIPLYPNSQGTLTTGHIGRNATCDGRTDTDTGPYSVYETLGLIVTWYTVMSAPGL